MSETNHSAKKQPWRVLSGMLIILCIFAYLFVWNMYPKEGKNTERTIAELKNQMVEMGLAMTMEELISDVPTEHNAAVVYNQLFEHIESSKTYDNENPSSLEKLINRSYNEENEPLSLALLEESNVKEVFRQIRLAASFENCQWERKYAEKFAMETPELTSMRSTARLIESAYELSKDAQYLEDMFTFTRHNYIANDTLIGFLVSMSLEGILHSMLENTEHAKYYAERLERLPHREGLSKVIQAEYILYSSELFNLLHQGEIKGEELFVLFGPEEYQGKYFESPNPLWIEDQKFLLKFLIKWHQVYAEERLKTVIDHSRFQLLEDQIPKEYLLSALTLSGLGSVVEKVAKIEERRRLLSQGLPFPEDAW